MSENPLAKTCNEWMIAALEEAGKSDKDVPVGCIITKGEQILGRGNNCREELNDPVGHAEIIALREAAKSLSSWRLEGCTLYSTLEPCPMCAEAIIQCRVERVFFGAYDLKSGACGSAFNLFKQGRIYPVPEVIGGIEEEVCKKLLSEYFEKKVRTTGNEKT